MKYKNIYAAIHNLGHSFLSSMNYVDGRHVVEDIEEIHAEGHQITIDWLQGDFIPKSRSNLRIEKSISHYVASIEQQFASLNVDVGRLTCLKFQWPVRSRKYMEATDDRGKHYKIYVRETK